MSWISEKAQALLDPKAYPGAPSGIEMGADPKVIEYAVKMRYVPQEAMMDVLLTQNQGSVATVNMGAQNLTEFHQKSETVWGRVS